MVKLEESQLVDQLEAFGDLPLALRAELDQTTITYRELLDLEPGRVIQLMRPTGENIAVYAENVLLAFGEVLLLEGVLTVRIAEIWSSQSVRGGSSAEQLRPAGATAEVACA